MANVTATSVGERMLIEFLEEYELADFAKLSGAPEAWSSNRCRESTPAESNASRCRSVV